MVWVCSINIGSIIFSGIFKDAPGPLKVLDFNNVLGSFGTLGTINDGVGTLAQTLEVMEVLALEMDGYMH